MERLYLLVDNFLGVYLKQDVKVNAPRENQISSQTAEKIEEQRKDCVFLSMLLFRG